MRVTALLLTLLILLMSGVPCCSTQSQCEDSLSGITQGTADSDSEEQHTDRPCSPFYTCGSCVGFVQAVELQISTKPEILPGQDFVTFHQAGVSGTFIHRLLRPPIPGFC